MPYDPTTDAGLVRLRINDRDAVIFSDDEISAFLTVEDGWRRAAALALETIASSEALILKVVTTLDLQTDGAKLGAELRAQAKELRRQAGEAAEASAGAFSVVPATYGGGNDVDEFARPELFGVGWRRC
jgi:hypothetical protein